ncbi:phosphoribosyl-ATP pyrophosphohydrolase [Methanosarcina sp. UBA411]|uniref:phosphoribosyl-ATP pyrophosphohydrolase n=1 Tax=Methanosarcina sp. UBA411 TaxID=1915589 RepID=UPI0025E922A9|nr:phosphoribosyl-ATP pyrophosphohydrolase [Methanosarcina sp. UBA411]
MADLVDLKNSCDPGKTMAENNSKAVRDLIPEILKLSGRECMIRELSDSSFLPELENKLEEELKEYLESKELEELVDLLEVIYRIAELRGSSKAELEAIRQRKKQEKGGFEKNILLLNPSEDSFHSRITLR